MLVSFKGEKLGEWKGLPTLREAFRLKAELGMLPGQFAEALRDLDPDAVCWLIALLKTRQGTPTKIADIDGEFSDFELELTEDEKAELAEAAEVEELTGKGRGPGMGG